MDHGNSRQPEKGALEILEGASLLLRMAPAGIICRYYLGAVPFVLGFLFFWVDMSSRGFAGSHLVHASFGAAALYVWMKCWQAVFVSRLRSFLEDAAPARWTPARILRLVFIQSALAPCMMIILPPALLITLPFGWCYAFVHNISIFGDGGQGLKASIRRAWQQCLLWPTQNHKILFIYLAFTLFVFFNVCVAGYLIPMLLKALLGIETVFTRSCTLLLNTTFLLSMAGVTYLCANPLIKAAYVLRCFHGESLSSGLDILSDWNRLRRIAGRVVPVLAISVLTAFFPSSGMASADVSDHRQMGVHDAPSVSPEKLDRAVSDVLGGAEYAWRLPRERTEEAGPTGFFDRALDAVGGWLKKLLRWAGDAIDWLDELLRKLMPEKSPGAASAGPGMFGSVKLWLTVLLVTVAMIAVLLLLKAVKSGKPGTATIAGEQVPRSEIDLSDESISVDQLPETRWLALAKRLLDDGDLRLALRAFYFAALAHLAERGLLTLSRFKSNRDYEREIKRRAHVFPGLTGAFSENIAILERVWYGMHGAGRETVRQFMDNQARIITDEHGQ